MSIVGGIDGFSELVRIYGRQFFRHGVLGKELQRGLAKVIGKESFILRKYLIQQSNYLAL